MRRVQIASALLVFVGFGITSALAADAPKPRMVLADEAWDFGTIVQGQTASKDIEIRNEGTADLEIKYVRSSCSACVGNVSAAEKIPAGRSGKVTITFYSKGLAGRQEKVVYIHGNDPDAPYKAVRVTGTVSNEPRPEINVEPETLDVGLIARDQKVLRTFTVTNSGKVPLTIKSVVASEACGVERAPAEPIKPGAKADIKVTVAGSKIKGLIQQFVSIQSDDPLVPTRTITIVGYVVEPGAATAGNAVIIKPVGEPVKMPGTGRLLCRAYSITNLLRVPVTVTLPGAGSEPAKGILLKPGEQCELKIDTGDLTSQAAPSVTVLLPREVPEK